MSKTKTMLEMKIQYACPECETSVLTCKKCTESAQLAIIKDLYSLCEDLLSYSGTGLCDRPACMERAEHILEQTQEYACPQCAGSGQYMTESQARYPIEGEDVTCPMCKGTGKKTKQETKAPVWKVGDIVRINSVNVSGEIKHIINGAAWVSWADGLQTIEPLAQL